MVKVAEERAEADLRQVAQVLARLEWARRVVLLPGVQARLVHQVLDPRAQVHKPSPAFPVARRTSVVTTIPSMIRAV
jgi:hypothetical protein